MKTADRIKSTMITRRAYKGSLIVEEVGLPISAEWDKSLRADLMERTDISPMAVMAEVGEAREEDG